MKIISVLLLAISSIGCGGYKSPTQSAPQAGIVPVVMAIVPNSATAGSPSFTLTVNGSNFNNNAVVNWNGAQRTTTHVTANQLTTGITAADIATAGMVPVSVTNPGSSTPGGPYGGGGSTASETSGTMTFTIK
ncbi:MAG TPA: IPT/TIG domain-containing protein [Terriglobales bacterium]|nr:IPT/TIG domain-containing protein [Terriglobales bacterium]